MTELSWSCDSHDGMRNEWIVWRVVCIHLSEVGYLVQLLSSVVMGLILCSSPLAPILLLAPAIPVSARGQLASILCCFRKDSVESTCIGESDFASAEQIEQNKWIIGFITCECAWIVGSLKVQCRPKNWRTFEQLNLIANYQKHCYCSLKTGNKSHKPTPCSCIWASCSWCKWMLPLLLPSHYY